MGEIKDENGRKERLPLFYDGESVTGKVRIDLQAVYPNVSSPKKVILWVILVIFFQVNVTLHRKTNRLEHHGIKIEFIGQIELYYDRGNHHEFLSLVKELARYIFLNFCYYMPLSIHFYTYLPTFILNIGLANWPKIRASNLNLTKWKNRMNVTLVQMSG